MIFFCCLLNVFFVIALLQHCQQPTRQKMWEKYELATPPRTHILDHPRIPYHRPTCSRSSANLSSSMPPLHLCMLLHLEQRTTKLRRLSGYHIRRVLRQQGGFRCGYQECLPLSRVLQPHDRVHRLILWKKSRNNMTLMLSQQVSLGLSTGTDHLLT